MRELESRSEPDMPALYDLISADQFCDSSQLDQAGGLNDMQTDAANAGDPPVLQNGCFVSVNVDDPTSPRIIAEVTAIGGAGDSTAQRATGRIIAQGETPTRLSDIYTGEPRISFEKWPGREGQCVVVYHPAAKLRKGIRSGRRFYSVRKYGEQGALDRARDTQREWAHDFAQAALECDRKTFCFCPRWSCPLNQPGNDEIHARDWCVISETNNECKLLRGLNKGSAAANKRNNIGDIIRGRFAGGNQQTNE